MKKISQSDIGKARRKLSLATLSPLEQQLLAYFLGKVGNSTVPKSVPLLGFKKYYKLGRQKYPTYKQLRLARDKLIEKGYIEKFTATYPIARNKFKRASYYRIIFI